MKSLQPFSRHQGIFSFFSPPPPFPLDAILESSKLSIDFAKSRLLHSLGLAFRSNKYFLVDPHTRAMLAKRDRWQANSGMRMRSFQLQTLAM